MAFLSLPRVKLRRISSAITSRAIEKRSQIIHTYLECSIFCPEENRLSIELRPSVLDCPSTSSLVVLIVLAFLVYFKFILFVGVKSGVVDR